MKPPVTIDDFAKLDLRVGEIVAAEEVPGSEKLVQLKVNFGPTSPRLRGVKIYAGIKKWYAPEKLVGRKLIFVVNLAAKNFKIGDSKYSSDGMLLAAGSDEAILYSFDKDLDNGTTIH